MFFRASERLIEILGEAAKRVSDGFAEAHPEIPWKAVRAQRDVLAHDYRHIEAARIWTVISEHDPALKRRIQALVEDLPPIEEE